MRNGFCFLTDYLPRKVQLNGKAIALDTTTASAVACLLYLKEEHSNTEKAEYCCARLFHTNFESVQANLQCTEAELDNYIFKYLTGYPQTKSGAELEGKKTGNNEFSTPSNKLPDFDFIQDSALIISAFRECYKMSLEELQNCHYWEFLALFRGLSDTTAFNQVRHIRTMKIDKKANIEYQEQIRQAKKSVALKDTRTTEQKREQGRADINNLEL